MDVQYYERRYSLGKEKLFIVEKSFMSELKKRKKYRKKKKSCKSVGVKPVKMTMSYSLAIS